MFDTTVSLWASRVVKWWGARTTTWLGLFVAGALVIAYARQTHFLSGLILLTAFSIPVAMLNTAMTPLLPVVVAGWLASTVLQNSRGSLGGPRFGPIDTIFAVAGLLIIIAARMSLCRGNLPRLGWPKQGQASSWLRCEPARRLRRGGRSSLPARR
jgi:hypothetical protein